MVNSCVIYYYELNKKEIKRLYFVDRGLFSENINEALRFIDTKEELRIISELELKISARIHLKKLDEEIIMF